MRILLVLLICAVNSGASEFESFVGAAIRVQNDSRAAIPLLIKAVKAWEPSDGKERLAAADAELGLQLISTGHDKEGETFLANAVSLAPNEIGPRVNHGIVLVRLGRIEEAIDEHVAVFRLDPENAANLTDLCAALVAVEEFARGRPYCERSAKLWPSQALPFLNLAMVYAELGCYQEAEAALATAKTKSPVRLIEADRRRETTNLRAIEAYVASLTGRWDEGEKRFLELMQEQSREPQPVALRGLARLRRGRYDDAITDFDKAYAMDPKAMLFVLIQRAHADQKAGRAALASEDRAKACAAGWAPACSKKKKA